MTDQTKSLIRHILTALGVVLGLLGLEKVTGFVQYILDNLDSLWSAVITIVGFVTAVIGFFLNRDKKGA
jgi:hypothetical protein